MKRKTEAAVKVLSATAALLLGLFVAGGALAHGKDGVHLLGTLQKQEGTTLVVKTREGKAVEVMTAADTKVERAGTAISAEQLRLGERVVVHAKKMSNGLLHAQLVKVGAKAAKPAGGAPAEHEPAAADGGTAQEPERHEHAR